MPVLERGMYFHHWDYVLTRQKQGGKVIVEQRHDGTVTFHEGWLKASEVGKAGKVKAAGTLPKCRTISDLTATLRRKRA